MKRLLLPALIYIGFVSGGVLPFLAENDAQIVVRTLFGVGALGVILYFGVDKRCLKVAFAYFIVCTVFLLPLFLFTSNQFYAAQKIESVVIGVLFCFVLISLAIRKLGWEGYKEASIVVAFWVFVLTVLYKIKFGFWDREVRFFLNGPIVFGWLMGLHALFSLMLWAKKGGARYIFSAVLFTFAVVWTQSKGPLLALGLCLAVFVLSVAKQNLKVFRNLVGGFTVLCVALAFNVDAVLDSLEGSRLQSIAALVTGETQENDEGSIGSRGAMLEEAIGFIGDSAPFGIGVGEWPNRSRSGLAYPHNQHLEVLVEMGVPWFLLHITFIIFSLIKGNWELRIVMLFFFVASSVSGDVSYMRYLYPFALISISTYGFRSARASSRRFDENHRAGG